MTEAEIEATLKAKPLYAGKLDAGFYRIYGSNESFRVSVDLHFTNIVVAFRKEKAVEIFTMPAGQWAEHFGGPMQILKQEGFLK
jgi:hypothetical protein